MDLQTQKTFERDLVALIPHLRAFARSLCGNPAMADDLAQEAVAKACNWKAGAPKGGRSA